MFEHIVTDLTTTEDFPKKMQDWCQQWCRMVNTGNDRENLSHPFGLLLASASQSNPQALQKMVGLMWDDDAMGFTSSPQSSLKTAVGTLLAIAAPLDAHLTLFTALKNFHQQYWTNPNVPKRQAMSDGVHLQTLSTVMDHMAHAYIIPIDNKLSGSQLATVLECAGPIFIERFTPICSNYIVSDNVLSAFAADPLKVSSSVMLRAIKSPTRNTGSNLVEAVSKNTTFNQIVEVACKQSPDDLQALDVDRCNFAAVCWASQQSDFDKKMEQVFNRRGNMPSIVQEVAGGWERLIALYPNENLSANHADVLQKFMQYCQPQHHTQISEDKYAQLQNLLLRSQTSNTLPPKTRKM